jgi:hypothetical protein
MPSRSVSHRSSSNHPPAYPSGAISSTSRERPLPTAGQHLAVRADWAACSRGHKPPAPARPLHLPCAWLGLLAGCGCCLGARRMFLTQLPIRLVHLFEETLAQVLIQLGFSLLPPAVLNTLTYTATPVVHASLLSRRSRLILHALNTKTAGSLRLVLKARPSSLLCLSPPRPSSSPHSFPPLPRQSLRGTANTHQAVPPSLFISLTVVSCLSSYV